MFFNVEITLRREHVLDDKENEIEKRDHGQNDEPEPENDVDLFGENVYGQNALHRILMIVAKLSDLEVAMSHFGKVMILDHVETERHAMQDLEAKQMIIANAKQTSHEKELTDDVDQVEQLDERVQYDEVVAESLACPEQKIAEKFLHAILESETIPLVAVLGLNERFYVTS